MKDPTGCGRQGLHDQGDGHPGQDGVEAGTGGADFPGQGGVEAGDGAADAGADFPGQGGGEVGAGAADAGAADVGAADVGGADVVGAVVVGVCVGVGVLGAAVDDLGAEVRSPCFRFVFVGFSLGVVEAAVSIASSLAVLTAVGRSDGESADVDGTAGVVATEDDVGAGSGAPVPFASTTPPATRPTAAAALRESTMSRGESGPRPTVIASSRHRAPGPSRARTCKGSAPERPWRHSHAA